MERVADMLAFVRVVEAGSITAAARQLGFSKAAVSKQVSRLEARLGVKLVERTARHSRATDVGVTFYERCRRIVAEIEGAEVAVSEFGEVPCGVLRVTAPRCFGRRHLGPLLPEFLGFHAGIQVDLALDDGCPDLRDEDFDVALRVGLLPEPSLPARRVARSRWLVCASPAYLRRRGEPKAPGDLLRHECIVDSGSPRPGLWRFRHGRSVRVRARVSTNDAEVARDAVLGGAGVALLPAFLLGADVREGRLCELMPGEAEGSEKIHAVSPPGREHVPKVRAFVDFLVERLADEPRWEHAVSDPL